MPRDLRIYRAGIHHPDERGIPAEQRTGSYIYVGVVSEDLKSRPHHSVPVTEDQAIELIQELSNALVILRRQRREKRRRDIQDERDERRMDGGL